MLNLITNIYIFYALIETIYWDFVLEYEECIHASTKYYVMVCLCLSFDNIFGSIFKYIPFYAIFKLFVFVSINRQKEKTANYLYNLYGEHLVKYFKGIFFQIGIYGKTGVEYLKSRHYFAELFNRGAKIGFLEDKRNSKQIVTKQQGVLTMEKIKKITVDKPIETKKPVESNKKDIKCDVKITEMLNKGKNEIKTVLENLRKVENTEVDKPASSLFLRKSQCNKKINK